MTPVNMRDGDSSTKANVASSPSREVAMSRMTAGEFLDEVAGNQKLQAKLEGRDHSDVVRIAGELGYAFTTDDLEEALVGRVADGQATGELSEEELERVAGGTVRKIPGRLKWSNITLKRG
jgi:predicted ribosomally synthesized peptide with nif11-like leader